MKPKKNYSDLPQIIINRIIFCVFVFFVSTTISAQDGSSSNLVQVILSWEALPFVLAARIPSCHTFLFSFF